MLPTARATLVLEEVGDELIVYDPARRMAHVLNAAAAAVLLMCDGHTSLDDLVATVAAESERPPGEVTSELTTILEQLSEQGLLDGSPAS
jgi:PqqD family protein of HPr-rel-A system